MQTPDSAYKLIDQNKKTKVLLITNAVSVMKLLKVLTSKKISV